jgi:hypothetical protein
MDPNSESASTNNHNHNPNLANFANYLYNEIVGDDDECPNEIL